MNNFKLDYDDARVLIVDENAQNLDVLSKILKLSDLRVSFACEPGRALELIRVSRPEIVISDIIFNDSYFDGFWLLKEISSDLVLCQIPVLVYTALDTEEYAEKAYMCGASAFIHKPLSADAILSRIASFVHRYRRYMVAVSLAMEASCPHNAQAS